MLSDELAVLDQVYPVSRTIPSIQVFDVFEGTMRTQIAVGQATQLEAVLNFARTARFVRVIAQATGARLAFIQMFVTNTAVHAAWRKHGALDVLWYVCMHTPVYCCLM